MKETIYMNDQMILLNYNKVYPKSPQDLLASKEFFHFFLSYFTHLKQKDEAMYRYFIKNETNKEQVIKEMIQVMKQLLFLEIQEIKHPVLENQTIFLCMIEQLYNYWRSFQRFAFVYAGQDLAVQATHFVDADSSFHRLIRSLYRGIQEKLQGRSNRVYRQLQAGTNATFTLRKHTASYQGLYACLQDILMIDTLLLRTPMILHPKANKRHGTFTQAFQNPLKFTSVNKEEWFCFPAKVGDLLAFIYFHRDFIASAVSLGNLFELANEEECKQKPDLICLFGDQKTKEQTVFYHDKEENIWIGSVGYHERIEYFGYLKKMCLTLHNVAQMQKGQLPIHGAFVNVICNNGKKKGILLMGDSGAGKSETIEALKMYGKDHIKDIEIVFDDMGTIHIEDGIAYAKGTEIGAFIRLDDLDPGTPYQDMDRSIFMNPESKNARVVLPVSSYDTIVKKHAIDMFCYANNYEKQDGIRKLETVEEAMQVCIEGKRMALGTTQEVGISKTFFANPFGPMQLQEQCLPLIQTIFQNLYEHQVFIGEIYTQLGFANENKLQPLENVAKALLAFLED